MFTGIVEELGRFLLAARGGATTRLRFGAEVVTAGMALGDSVAVNGCCLTVVASDRCSFAVDALDETLARTNLGQLEPGEAVNLERPVALGARLGGHLVQGHVDATGTIAEAAPHLAIEVPAALEPYLVEKGSLAVDGCSLTLVAVAPELVRIEIIPHTAGSTTLGQKRPGQLVNLEVDVVAKYVERLVRAGTPSPYDRAQGEP
ncbi:MAG: riboflavin synthase [Actinomycetota bacterium]|jgi:riboflavin synthase|nr:riboflavin synthase [Actinomycetota bacterium]